MKPQVTSYVAWGFSSPLSDSNRRPTHYKGLQNRDGGWRTMLSEPDFPGQLSVSDEKVPARSDPCRPVRSRTAHARWRFDSLLQQSPCLRAPEAKNAARMPPSALLPLSHTPPLMDSPNSSGDSSEVESPSGPASLRAAHPPPGRFAGHRRARCAPSNRPCGGRGQTHTPPPFPSPSPAPAGWRVGPHPSPA